MWIVSNQVFCDIYFKAFSSPCGVWIVSGASTGIRTSLIRFRPLAGCELFPAKVHRPSSCSAGKPSLFTNYSIDRSFLQGKSPALTRQIPRRIGAKPEKIRILGAGFSAASHKAATSERGLSRSFK